MIPINGSGARRLRAGGMRAKIPGRESKKQANGISGAKKPLEFGVEFRGFMEKHPHLKYNPQYVWQIHERYLKLIKENPGRNASSIAMQIAGEAGFGATSAERFAFVNWLHYATKWKGGSEEERLEHMKKIIGKKQF